MVTICFFIFGRGARAHAAAEKTLDARWLDSCSQLSRGRRLTPSKPTTDLLRALLLGESSSGSYHTHVCLYRKSPLLLPFSEEKK